MQWTEGDVKSLLHIVLRCWWDHLAEVKYDKKLAEFEEHMRQTLRKSHGIHEHVLEKALVQWGKGDRKMLLHSVVKCWSDYLADTKEHGKHDHVMERTIMQC